MYDLLQEEVCFSLRVGQKTHFWSSTMGNW